jgi:hypothetical protein
VNEAKALQFGMAPLIVILHQSLIDMPAHCVGCNSALLNQSFMPCQRRMEKRINKEMVNSFRGLFEKMANTTIWPTAISQSVRCANSILKPSKQLRLASRPNFPYRTDYLLNSMTQRLNIWEKPIRY